MTTINREKLVALTSEFRLSAGNHANPQEGLCAMEVVAFLDGGPHTDKPRCACQIISAYVRHINDHMPDDRRQGLLPYLPRIIGTVSEELEQQRHEFFAWETVRIFAPAALRAQGYHRSAQVLQNAETLWDARFIAEDLERGIARKETGEELSPTRLALHRAARAAGAATWFASHQNDAFKGASSITPYTQCADAAAGAAFQAHRAGAVGVWDKTLEVLEGALSVGSRSSKCDVLAPMMDWAD